MNQTLNAIFLMPELSRVTSVPRLFHPNSRHKARQERRPRNKASQETGSLFLSDAKQQELVLETNGSQSKWKQLWNVRKVCVHKRTASNFALSFCRQTNWQQNLPVCSPASGQPFLEVTMSSQVQETIH